MAIGGLMIRRVPLRRSLTTLAVALLMVLTACNRGNDNGRFNFGHETINEDDPKYKAAIEKCRDLLPAGDKHDRGGPETVQNLVKFAQCMRDNGVPDFPDPDANGNFPRDAEQKAHSDTQFQAAEEKCRKDLPQHGGG